MSEPVAENKRLRRKVTSYERFPVYSYHHNAYRQSETLECGHIIRNKGSVGEASFRYCSECFNLQSGYKYYEDGIITIWNPEEKMPKRIPYQIGLVPFFDKCISEGKAKCRLATN